VLERACTASANLPVIDGHSIAWFGELPAPPSTYLDLRRLASDPRTAASALTAVVQRDVGLAARTLALANSVFLGVRQPVSNLAHAIGYVGIELLAAMVLAGQIETLATARKVSAAKVARVASHGLATGLLAREMHQRDQADAAFAAGLLHDIGTLVLATFAEPATAVPTGSPEILENDGAEQLAAEIARYGIDHASAGAHLLRLWGLPPNLVDAIARHHDPTLAAKQPLAATIHVASALVHDPRAELPGEVLAALAHPADVPRFRELAGARH
jgi:putative nucleotidyltransferase with HDIG domain